MGEVKSKDNKLRHGTNSESFNTSTSKRRVKRAKQLFWSYALKGMIGLGVPMAFLPLKIKAADAAQFETAKNEVGKVLADIKVMFESQKGVAEQRMPATSKDVKRLLKAIDSYNKKASQKIEISGKNEKEKMKSLNELLGVKIDGKYPDYLAYQTVVELEKSMNKINVDTVYGADIAAVSASAVGMVAEEKPPAAKVVAEKEKEVEPAPVEEGPPPPTFGEAKEAPPIEAEEALKEKMEAPEESAWAKMAELEKVDFHLEVISTLKNVVVKPSKPKAPKKPGKKATEEDKAEYEEKMKAYKEAKEEYNAKLDVYKEINSAYKDLSIIKKTLEKGKQPKKKYQKVLEEIGDLVSIQEQLEAAGYILSGTTTTNPIKAEYMANVNAGTYENLKAALSILTAEINTFVSYFNQELKVHENNVNNIITKVLGKGYHKIDYKKEAAKLGYDLSTVGGALQMLDWVYHKDNELFYQILQQKSKESSLSSEAEAAVKNIADIRALRAQIWHEQKTNQSFAGGKQALETAIENAKTTFGAEEPIIKTAEVLLNAEEVTYSNMYYEAALSLLAIQEAQIWYDTPEISGLEKKVKKEKTAKEVEVESNINMAKYVFGLSFGEYPQPVDMSLSAKLAYHAIHTMTPETLEKYEMHVYHKGEPGTVKGNTASEWEEGIKGSLVYKATDPTPIYGHFLTTILTEGGVYPYYMRGVEPGYADYETNEELNYSPYGFTVGEVERQQFHLSKENLEKYTAVLSRIPEGYGWISNEESDFTAKIKKPAMEKIITKLKDEKEEELKKSIPQYNQGLTKAAEVEKEDGTVTAVFAPVTIQLLEMFGEGKKNKDYKTEEGKLVPVKEGEKLKTAEYAEKFYAFWNNINSEQKIEELTINVLVDTLLPLHEYLENNLTDEAKKNPHVKYLLENIPKITSKEEAEKALGELQKTDLWIDTYYSFETAEDEKRYESAATINEVLNSDEDVNFTERHQIALAELAAVEAKAMKKTVYGKPERIEVPPPPPPVTEPAWFGALEELYANKNMESTPVIYGTGTDFFLSVEDVEMPAEFRSSFGEDAVKENQGKAAIREALDMLNNGSAAEQDAAAKQLHESLNNLLEDYAKTNPQMQEALNLLKEGSLKEGIAALSDAPGFAAVYEALSKFYKATIHETGIDMKAFGCAVTFKPTGALKEFWPALTKKESIKHVLLYSASLGYQYGFSESPMSFSKMKYATASDVASGAAEFIGQQIPIMLPKAPGGELVPKAVPGVAETEKHKVGAQFTLAAPTAKGTEGYLGNVWTATVIMNFSYETIKAYGIDKQSADTAENVPKEILMKGKSLGIDFLGVDFRFPGIEHPVKIESIKTGFTLMASLMPTEELEGFKPGKIPVYAGAMASTTIVFDLIDKDKAKFQMYVTPSLLLTMKDPALAAEMGFRTMFFNEKQALLLQLGGEVIYPSTTAGKLKWKGLLTAVWNTGTGLLLTGEANIGGSTYNVTELSLKEGGEPELKEKKEPKLSYGVGLKATISPMEIAAKLKSKQAKDAKKTIDKYIKICEDNEFESELKRLKEYDNMLAATGSLSKTDRKLLKELTKEIDAKLAGTTK